MKSNPPLPIKVLLVDDHQSILDGYRFRLGSHPNISIVGAVRHAEAMWETLEQHCVDVMLLDIGLPISSTDSNRFPLIPTIHQVLTTYPNTHILIISMHTDRALVRSVLKAGANGYILKDDHETIERLAEVITLVANGDIHFSKRASILFTSPSVKDDTDTLTGRQQEALSYCLAYPNESTRDLASRMDIAHSTFRNLLSNAYIRLGVSTRVAAIHKARELGLITPNPIAPPLP
jgi:two-component system, NarL family, nitrate/nitrite response regulator NarL